MSVHAINWALMTPTGGPHTKVLLIALANYANGDCESYPSIERLARETDMSPSTVKRHLTRLVETGLVERTARGGDGEGRQTNLYTLMMPGRVAKGQPDPMGLQVKSRGATGQIKGGKGSLVTPKPKNQEEPQDSTPTADAAEDEALLPTPPRIDVQRVCNHMAANLRANDCKATVTDLWRKEARLMLDLDKRPEAEIHRVIDWVSQDPFWKSNVLGVPKLRVRYDQLRLRMDTDKDQVQHRPVRELVAAQGFTEGNLREPAPDAW